MLLIQIHLMLFFICPDMGAETDTAIQIHLMLFFIAHDIVKDLEAYVFKYISCYSLSFWEGKD